MIARREKEDNTYERLGHDALTKIQALSGNRWTDFNEHDPGVTILDTLHYALFELDYSLQFPFESYLKKGRTGFENHIDFNRLGLFQPGELFEPAIVTPRDYEQLIVNTIKEVEACRVTVFNHRYLIEVESGELKMESEKQFSTLNYQLSILYHAHRNLGETLQEVRISSEKLKVQNRNNYDCPEYAGCQETANANTVFSQAHYSIQNHFPDCYGINEKGMPANADEETQAKIRQLQAYLLIFDYLLANTKQQIAAIPQLLELSGGIPATQLPEVELNGIENLIDSQRFIESRANDETFLHVQKSHYLDMLDALYGEDTRRFFANESDLSVANQKRAELIRKFPQLNANRFRSFNILEKNETGKNSSGIQQFLSAISGAKSEETSVVNLFSRYNFRLLSDEEFFREYKRLNMEFITDYIEHQLFDYELELVPQQSTVYNDSLFYKLRNRIHFLHHHLLFESFLTEGPNPLHYRIAGWHKTKGYLLIFKIPNKREWLNLGFFDDKQTLIETANLLWQFLKMLRKQSQQIYLVEHVLLNDADDDYNVLTIVIPHWAKFSFPEQEYENLLRERLPVHLDIRFHGLDAEKMYDFEKIYYEWREALASQNEEWVELTSMGIRSELGISN